MAGRSRQSKRDPGAELMLAPVVMMMRLPLMAAEIRAFPTLTGETARAATEKAAAFAEGMAAAQVALLGAAARFWPDILAGRSPAVFSGTAALRVVDAALAPSGRRVRANYARLSRRKGR